MSVTWEVGQEVILREPDYRGGATEHPAVVTRVARKYVYAGSRRGRERAFDKETGIERGESNYKARLFTPESLAESNRRGAALKRVGRELTRWGWPNRLSTDALEKIADLIAGAVQP